MFILNHYYHFFLNNYKPLKYTNTNNYQKSLHFPSVRFSLVIPHTFSLTLHFSPPNNILSQYYHKQFFLRFSSYWIVILFIQKNSREKVSYARFLNFSQFYTSYTFNTHKLYNFPYQFCKSVYWMLNMKMGKKKKN